MAGRASDPKRDLSREIARGVQGQPRTSWGTWGSNDRLGTLNHIDPGRVRDAARLVQKGLVVSLNLGLTEIDPPLFGRTAVAREVRALASGTAFDETLTWNVQTTSQWDGFGHVVEPSVGSYNGLDREQHGVGLWLERGIVGRGILADVARRRSRMGHSEDPLRRGEIAFSEVLAALKDEGLAPRAGDILLVRTGWLAAYRSLTPQARIDLAAGAGKSLGLANSIETVQGLWTARVAAVAADNPSLEAWPPTPSEGGAASFTADWAPAASLHRALLVRLGMPIGELWDLDRLAEVCAAEKRYEFLLASVPIALIDGIASPA